MKKKEMKKKNRNWKKSGGGKEGKDERFEAKTRRWRRKWGEREE